MGRSHVHLYVVAVLAVGFQWGAASSLHSSYELGGGAAAAAGAAAEAELAPRLRKEAPHTTAASWDGAAGVGWSTLMASVAVVLAAAMAGVGFLCCTKEVPMEAQLNSPVNLTGKRKRFSYVGVDAESKGMARINSKASIEMSMTAGFMGGDGGGEAGGGMNGGFDFGRGDSVRSVMTDGYIDVGMDDGAGAGAWHIPLESTKQVVVGRDGRAPTSPSKMARRQSATQAFGSFAALAQNQQRFIVPFDDGPAGGDIGGLPAPMGMSASSRKNPLFDADAMGAIFGSSTPDPFGDNESVRSIGGGGHNLQRIRQTALPCRSSLALLWTVAFLMPQRLLCHANTILES